MAAASEAQNSTDPPKWARVEPTPDGRPRHRRPLLLWGVLTAALAIGLVVVLVLAITPLVSETISGETWVGYQFPVAANVQWSSQAGIFHGICESSTETAVGNQSALITWATTNARPVIEVQIVLVTGYPVLTWLANFTNVSTGGYAQSGAHVLNRFCPEPFEIFADASVNLTLTVKAALLYNYSAEASIL
jgi:hypothetical protein